MKEVRKTSQFKKDFKRFSKDSDKIRALYQIVAKIANEEEIPSVYRPHPLKGDWRGFMECHIGDDYLLIWYDKEQDFITLVRLGSHSELFGKSKKK